MSRNVKVESVTPRVQFALSSIDGAEMPATRASVVKVAPGVYRLRYRVAGGEHLVEVKGDVRVGVDYDVTGLAGVHCCREHGPKIQRPAGHFDCEPCFKAYAKKAREVAKERKANGTAALSPAERRQQERDAVLSSRLDALMGRLEAKGLALHQQAERVA